MNKKRRFINLDNMGLIIIGTGVSFFYYYFEKTIFASPSLTIFITVGIILLISLPYSSSKLSAQRRDNDRQEPVKLDNPISVEYLKKNLNKQIPRIALNKKLEIDLKKKLKTDPVIENVYKAIKLNAEGVF